MSKHLKNSLRYMFAGSIFFIIILSAVLLSSCNETSLFPSEEGSQTEISVNYESGATKAYFLKHAPYETRIDSADPDLKSVADFTIGLETIVIQSFAIPEDSVLMEIKFSNIAVTQPQAGNVEIREARLSWPPPNMGSPESAQISGNSFIVPRESYVNIDTNEYEVSMYLSNDVIGTLTKPFDSLSGTQAEADAHFMEFAGNYDIGSDKLRFALSYKVEIKVFDAVAAKEVTLFKNISIELFPGDFISQELTSESPYDFENSGNFSQ